MLSLYKHNVMGVFDYEVVKYLSEGHTCFLCNRSIPQGCFGLKSHLSKPYLWCLTK
jgi:hypothetical protein